LACAKKIENVEYKDNEENCEADTHLHSSKNKNKTQNELLRYEQSRDNNSRSFVSDTSDSFQFLGSGVDENETESNSSKIKEVRLPKLRDKMTKFGSVVKSVKANDKRNLKSFVGRRKPTTIAEEGESQNRVDNLMDLSESNNNKLDKATSPHEEEHMFMGVERVDFDSPNDQNRSESIFDDIKINDDSVTVDLSEMSIQDDASIDSNSPLNPKKRSRVPKLRDRMTKLGASVKNMKVIDRNTLKQLNSPSFSNYKSEIITVGDANESTHGVGMSSNFALISKAIKVKNLRSENSMPRVMNKEKVIPLQLFKVSGVWTVSIDFFEEKPEAECREDVGKLQERSHDCNSFVDVRIILRLESLQLTGVHGISKPIKRSLNDIVKFHTFISESIASIGGNSSTYIQKYHKGIVDEVMSCGRILRSLIEYDLTYSIRPKFSCALKYFFESLLSSPLPFPACNALSNFLDHSFELEDFITNEARNIQPKDIIQSKDVNLKLEFKEFNSIISECERQVQECLKQGTCMQALSSSLSNSFLQKSVRIRPLVHVSPPNILHQSIHETLATVMAERDEAHAQLVAASVLHCHEMEQERKKVTHLRKKLSLLENLSQVNKSPGAPFFLGLNDIAEKDVLKKHEKEMVQNTDAEILSLCHQLSAEISARTSVELQLIRLKESINIEREAEVAQRKSLQKDLNRYKKMLYDAKQMNMKMKRENDQWKKAFEDIS